MEMVYISSVSRYGEVVLKFRDSIHMKGYSLKNVSSFISIAVFKGSPTITANYNYTWEVLSFSELEIRVLLKFSNPLLISIQEKDIILVQILKGEKFIFKKSDLIMPKKLKMTAFIPKQIG